MSNTLSLSGETYHYLGWTIETMRFMDEDDHTNSHTRVVASNGGDTVYKIRCENHGLDNMDLARAIFIIKKAIRRGV